MEGHIQNKVAINSYLNMLPVIDNLLLELLLYDKYGNK